MRSFLRALRSPRALRSAAPLIVVAAATVACLSACTTAPFVPDAERVPEEFSINATVLRGAAVAPVPRVEQRPGRWVLLPDGSLRASSTAQPDHGSRPGVVRHLQESEIAELWSLAVRLGIGDPAAGDPVGDARAITAGPTELVQIIEFHGGGKSWGFVARGPAADGGDKVLGTFLRALAERSWMEDRPAELDPAAAIRYDMGPDPYARYRGQPTP